MKFMTPARARWAVVVIFAIAMAWMEAATVYYLRLLVDRLEPYQANPLPISGPLTPSQSFAAPNSRLTTAGDRRRTSVAYFRK